MSTGPQFVALVDPRAGFLIALLFSVTVGMGAAGAEAPAFRQGVWEYESTVGANKFVAKECIDPGKELRQQDATLEKIGCKLSTSIQGASTYTSVAQCTVKLPSGFASWSTTSILTMESDSAYRMETHTVRNGRTRDEVVTARRVADCSQ